jgi:uncharacterized protein (TIGR02246 family)
MSCTRFVPPVLGLCLGIAWLSNVSALHAQSSSGDEAAIRSILQRQQDAWNKGDAKAFAADAEEDCLFTNIIGTPYPGRKDFEERHATIFRTVFAGSHLAIRIRTLKIITPDVAITESELALRDYKGLPPGVHASEDGVLYTELEEVFVKRGSDWRMAAFHNVDRKPPAQASMTVPKAGAARDNETYQRDYGFTATGTVAGKGPFALVGRFTADGHGNIAGSQTRNFNGQIVLETYTETYTVSPDGTGSSQKQTSTGIHADSAFVALNHGKTIMAVQTEGADIVTLRAERSE